MRVIRRSSGAARWEPRSGRAALLAVMGGLVLLVAAGVALWWRQSSPSVDVAGASPDAGEVQPGPSREMVSGAEEPEGVREPVSEQVETPEVLPEGVTPQESGLDEMAYWAENLDRKMEKFLEDPGDLENAHKLHKHCIKALLSMEGRYTVELEGVPTDLPTSSEDETWISSSGPFGHRLFIVSRYEFPEHFELSEVENQKGSERGDFLAPLRIDEDLSGRILFTANRVRERLPKRE